MTDTSLFTFEVSLVAEPAVTLSDTVRAAEDAAKLLTPIAGMNQEAFVVVPLDGGNHVRGKPYLVTLGLLNSNQVHPREVFAPAIVKRAASIIVAHNHPSGTLEASPEDIALTDRLVKAGKLLGIPVLDHIILTPDGRHLSMKSAGYL